MPGVVLTLCHHEGLPKGKEEELGSISQTLLFHDLPRSGCLGCPGASVQFSPKALKAQLQPWGICSFSSWVTAAQAAKRELVLQKGWVVCHLTVPMGWHTLAKLQTSHELLVLNVWQMEEVAFLSAGNIWVQVKTTVQEWPSLLTQGVTASEFCHLQFNGPFLPKGVWLYSVPSGGTHQNNLLSAHKEGKNTHQGLCYSHCPHKMPI